VPPAAQGTEQIEEWLIGCSQFRRCGERDESSVIVNEEDERASTSEPIQLPLKINHVSLTASSRLPITLSRAYYVNNLTSNYRVSVFGAGVVSGSIFGVASLVPEYRLVIRTAGNPAHVACSGNVQHCEREP
jgi:hypothetical protein